MAEIKLAKQIQAGVVRRVTNSPVTTVTRRYFVSGEISPVTPLRSSL